MKMNQMMMILMNLSENESDFKDLETENGCSYNEPEIVESKDSPMSC